ncbi:MAG TPA: dihydrodipicolinate synthase family protein [Gemmatimonadaceae bacterium]|nr:dihydrodipicolinate synthase family protein [Gemmatimonadaceae bacterium]
MTNKSLEGVLAPVVSTFYKESGELDCAAFAANARAHLAAGMNGIVVTGSTGEAALLDFDERASLVDVAREMVPREKWLIVGTGAESTRTCVKQTRDAAERGADAVLVVAPHYYASAMTGPALMQHYWRVAEESSVPVILYNIPKYMHFALAPNLVSELAAHPNVIGIKDSSGNRELFSSYMNIQSAKFAVLDGNAQLFQHAMESGARGGILAAALFAPALCVEIYEAVKRGDAAAATAAQSRLTPLGAKIVGELGVAGVKAAMDRVGLSGGPVRSPLVSLDAEQGEIVEGLLKSELVGA